MITFTKAQIASLVATGIDFLVTILLIRVIVRPDPSSGIAGTLCSTGGTICGGISHFLISRAWVFKAQEQKWSRQVPRYILVWTGNLLLNASLFYLLTHQFGVNYVVAKVVIAVGIAVFYNYTLQKRFVFK